MTAQSVTLLEWLLAISPILAVLVLMVGFRWGGARAGPVGWLVALVISLLFFGADAQILAYSQAKAVLLSLYVLYIIWMALVLYNVVQESGAMNVIVAGIVSLTDNPVLQLLILSWVFSAFLQGVAGFGVPIAVVAPLLIGLGFSPVTSVAAVAAGHSWSVTFGDIASSFNALIAATNLPGEFLAPWSAIFLGVACFGCGLAAVFAYQGLKSVRRGLPAIILIGTVMSLTQYVLAVNRLWNLAGFVAGLVGLAASAAVARFSVSTFATRLSVSTAGAGPGGGTTGAGLPQHAFARQASKPSLPSREAASPDRPKMSFFLAIVPYLVLIVIVIIAELVPFVHRFLNQVQLTMAFPETVTASGWVVPAETGKKISLFGHAGALLLYVSVVGYAVYALAGHYQPGALKRIVSRTTRSAVRSSIGIVSMVGFALIMDQTGMTNLLAVGMSQALESVFPFLSPYIGLLGAFMTGSNTNSNVVFANLQRQTAELLGLPVAVILAAQTTGGSLGSMLAPAKIIVGCSTAGLAGEEGQVLRRTITYGVIIAAVIGALAWLFTR